MEGYGYKSGKISQVFKIRGKGSWSRYLPFGLRSLGRAFARGSRVMRSVMAIDIVIASKPLESERLDFYHSGRDVIRCGRLPS